MRSRFWILGLSLHLFGVLVVAQSAPKRQMILQVANGGFVAFRSETTATNTGSPREARSLASLIQAQAFLAENRIVHRVITDTNQQVIFGYDLLISPDAAGRKFILTVMPADDSFRRSFSREGSNDLFATFPRPTPMQTLDDGDAVSLELLINRELGLKIVDVVRVTFDRTRLFEDSLEGVPKDFTLDAVSLAMKNYELLIDGVVVGKRKSTVGFQGALLWFYVPQRGRFIVSLVPRSGYDFQKVGIIDGNRIEFFADGSHYEWHSNAPILAGGGSWRLWVLHDKNYSPLFSVVPTPEEKPGLAERINDAVKIDPRTSGLRVTPGLPKKPNKVGDNSPAMRQPVMVGGADNMDNLLPRSSSP